MTLLDVEKDGGCLYSEWRLTYRVGWGHICSAVSLIYRYTDEPELAVGDASGGKDITVKEADEILKLDEMGWFSIRGKSRMLDVPVYITFYNQTDYVRVSVLCVNEEFSEADYKKFNLSMCQFMDSIEIAMYS